MSSMYLLLHSLNCRVKMNRMRMRIASRLKEAQNTNAMLTTFNELDMSAIMQLRKDNQDAFVKKHGIKMGFMSAFVKASAYALTKQPTVNAVIEGQETIYRDYVDISVAVATPKVCRVDVALCFLSPYLLMNFEYGACTFLQYSRFKRESHSNKLAVSESETL